LFEFERHSKHTKESDENDSGTAESGLDFSWLKLLNRFPDLRRLKASLPILYVCPFWRARDLKSSFGLNIRVWRQHGSLTTVDCLTTATGAIPAPKVHPLDLDQQSSITLTYLHKDVFFFQFL
jgi:hypothetical protein